MQQHARDKRMEGKRLEIEDHQPCLRRYAERNVTGYPADAQIKWCSNLFFAAVLGDITQRPPNERCMTSPKMLRLYSCACVANFFPGVSNNQHYFIISVSLYFYSLFIFYFIFFFVLIFFTLIFLFNY